MRQLWDRNKQKSMFIMIILQKLFWDILIVYSKYSLELKLIKHCQAYDLAPFFLISELHQNLYYLPKLPSILDWFSLWNRFFFQNKYFIVVKKSPIVFFLEMRMRWDNNVRDIIINKGGVNLPKFLQKRKKKRFNIFKKRCYFFSIQILLEMKI